MIISTLYLPETTTNLRHQHVPPRSACAGQANCSIMTGTIRWRVLVIARLQVFESCVDLWDVLVYVMTEPCQCGLRIAAAPSTRLVGVLAKTKTPHGAGPIEPPYQLGQMFGFVSGRTSATRNTSYPLTACRSASTCLTCSCPASRANFSVTYAHVAVHPQEQVGRLTSRLPSFSGRITMLWVTLLIFLLLTHPNPCTRSTWDPLPREVKFTCDDGPEDHAGHRLTAGTRGVSRAPARNRLH
jgi:hypothetical protein